MNTTQLEKIRRFQTLHQSGTFVIPNPWDAGSARILASLGFEALATSSSASAISAGRHDGGITRDEALVHARTIVNAVNLPVSADLENGFGDDPKTVAETIRLAAETGLAGGSIEDAGSGDTARVIYDFNHAVERVAAAVEAARALPVPFVLTARAENFFRGKPDLDDTIRRLQAYEKAGADVLFAPSLPDLNAVRLVCASVSKPVNFMAGIPGKSFSIPELAAAGVRRISVGASLHRAALGGFVEAAREIKERGTFQYTTSLLPIQEVYRLLGG
jgi:2-methylisocitrate lyase-like PEP mutase family enzyme